MKRKKRVKRHGRIAQLRASAGNWSVERKRSTSDREAWNGWRKRRAELSRWRKAPKRRVTLKLDADVLDWFRGLGRGYQWEMNRALRKVMEEEKQGSVK